MYLGSKGQISTVEPDQARKKEKFVQGQIDVEHGDIVIVRTYETELDLGLKPQGFGFCESFSTAFRAMFLPLVEKSASRVKYIHRRVRHERARGIPSPPSSARSRH